MAIVEFIALFIYIYMRVIIYERRDDVKKILRKDDAKEDIERKTKKMSRYILRTYNNNDLIIYRTGKQNKKNSRKSPNFLLFFIIS